jgi:hypothetical protein
MTGIFVRVEREGHGTTAPLEQCSEAELRQLLEGRTGEELVRWIVVLVAWIRDNVQEEGVPG